MTTKLPPRPGEIHSKRRHGWADWLFGWPRSWNGGRGAGRLSCLAHALLCQRSLPARVQTIQNKPCGSPGMAGPCRALFCTVSCVGETSAASPPQRSPRGPDRKTSTHPRPKSAKLPLTGLSGEGIYPPSLLPCLRMLCASIQELTAPILAPAVSRRASARRTVADACRIDLLGIRNTSLILLLFGNKQNVGSRQSGRREQLASERSSL